MAIAAIEIHRLLPKIDCGQCPAKSCMAFARAVSEGRTVLSECNRLAPSGYVLIHALFCQGE